MKKIYLFSMMVLGFVATSVGQHPTSCPGPLPPASDMPVVDPAINACVVTWLYTGLVGADNWYLALVKDDGTYIPERGTGKSFVKIEPSGYVDFWYNCSVHGSPVEARLLYLAPGDVEVIRCHVEVVAAAPTPVKLTSFTGRLQNDNAVVLDWSSAIELDSYKYEVERSDDGLHFTKVGTIEAAGNSVTTIKYTFNDQLPAAGAYFYRLKQIDFDGTFEHSKVVYVNSKKGAGAVTKVFPNPTKGEIQLIGATSADLQPNNLSIFSISGQRIKYQVIGNAISMDPAAPDGVYIIRLQSAAGLQQFKVVKNQSAKTY
jgi:hypothetical protein